ncbi:hypothetical protein [Flammeovirga sp. SJP92]|uniref:hypothetical protein n=1 Tax=Flammeovirga sp. SJP92 TaxID=1775430 RepID=UPI000786DFB9|nr:hypothetical protein [Flammeovirga sp. SJP92]KXX69069.1 hypothetical protein AVL50_18105 [Flammeovirga sp. SJP92]
MGFESSAIKSLENNRREIRQVTTGRFPSKNMGTNLQKKPLRFKEASEAEKKKFKKKLWFYKFQEKAMGIAFWVIGISAVLSLSYWMFFIL